VPNKLIGLSPPSAARSLQPLLETLEDAYPVRFEPRERDALDGLDGLVMLSGCDGATPACRTLVYPRPEPGPSTVAPVSFTRSGSVDSRLRGRSLLEREAPAAQLVAAGHDEVLATRDGTPAWTRRASAGAAIDFAGAPPQALAPGESLRDHLRAGRFLALLPLVSFLRELSAEIDWVAPPLRGLIMFDDPNLRWSSYGYIDYRELARHAAACGYHAAMGMIPIDGRPVHGGAAALFRGKAPSLSLLMHGLRHLRVELTQNVAPAARDALVARALRQIAGFERRSGVAVSRVMCPPHGEASEAFLGTLLRFGLEAFVNDLPLPWTSVQDSTRAARLRGWTGVSFVAGGLPVLPRHHFKYPADDLVLRAFLDHPLIVYGHHDDLADGLEPLAETAALLNSLGVEWGPASWIARAGSVTREAGETLRVQLRGRQTELIVAPDKAMIELEIPAVHGELDECEVACGGAVAPVQLSDSAPTVVTVPASPGPVTVELRSRVRRDPRSVPAPRVDPWPVVRRAMTEARDRVRPLGGWRDPARWAS
jgi:hypothetical protein